jgi:RNA polymerase sigma factor (sigma-70 family)
MVPSAIIRFLDQIRGSAVLREGAEQTDAQLLEAFLARRDAGALEALVRRHAPMVWGVCRRTLADHHDAEDAFQATFLVLVRRAASVRTRERLANWLYGVAHKTACKAGQRAAKRSARERQVSPMPEPRAAESRDCAFGPELCQLLHEELSRLPAKYRAPIVLCDLEDKSRVEAARQLRLPEGTVASRLARGRALLARRLTRHGLAVSAASVAALWSRQASGALPDALLTRTVKAVGLLAAGRTLTAGLLSAEAPPLTDAVLRALTAPRRRAAGAVLLLAGLALGGGMVAYHLLANRPENALVRPQDHARSGQADEPVIAVTASYPGANGQVVADTVAHWIEDLINEEVEGVVRIESTSDNDGNYTAHVYFKPEADLNLAMKLVEIAVWRAEPTLAPAVVRNKVSVKIGKAVADPNQVAIVVIDRENGDRQGLQKVASAVLKRLEAEHALTKPQVFPGDDVKQLAIYVDHTKCASLGVTPTEVSKALEAAAPVHGVNTNTKFGSTGASAEGKSVKPEDLNKVVVRDKVTLGDVAIFKEVYVPAAVYRVDRCVAFRITGAPPEGKSVAEATAKCVELTEPEVKRIELRDFAVKSLSVK